AFDKTGTLTRGTPEVVEVIALNGLPQRSVVGLAAAVEQRSDHPIADAIVQHAVALDVAVPPATDVAAVAGRGVEGLVGGGPVVLGNRRLFEDRGLWTPSYEESVDRITTRGRTAVLVAWKGEPIGIIGIADRPRETARDAIRLLRDQGVESFAML